MFVVAARTLRADAGRPAGILFTRINLDTFGSVHDNVVSELAAALGNVQTRLALLTPGRNGTESAILQIAVMIVFSLHEASREVDESQPRYVEAGHLVVLEGWWRLRPLACRMQIRRSIAAG